MAAEITGKPAVAYPNSGEAWDPLSRSWSGPVDFDMAEVHSWAAAGAALIGGCCRVGPALVGRIASALQG